MTKTVMIVVTHLLGTGHLSRALTLGRSFAAKGHEVHVVSGGFAAPHLVSSGVSLHQLPPLRSDGTNFTSLLTEDRMPADQTYLQKRIDKLLSLYRDFSPDILITELFPFGRRILASEFHALLEEASGASRIFASIRDILAPPSKPAKVEATEDIIARYYHGVLVHSDANAVPLETSWPVTETIASKLRYTGFVASPLPKGASDGDGVNEIIVSVGGGNVGGDLLGAAIRAAHNHPFKWRCLVPQDQVKTYTSKAPSNMIIEPLRPDFRALLRRAKASVSLCGYNTAMDILQIGLPAVVMPFEDGGEVEQRLRVNALSQLDGIESLEAPSAGSLRDALDRALAAPRRDVGSLNFNGADETVRICMEDL